MEQQIARGDADSANNQTNKDVRAAPNLMDDDDNNAANASNSGSGVIERLVAKHVSEVAALERRWEVECNELRRNQRRDYRADVIELANEMQRRRSGAANADTRPLLSQRSSSSAVQRTLSTGAASSATSTQTATTTTTTTTTSTTHEDSPTSMLANSMKKGLSLLKFGRRDTSRYAVVQNNK